jgi:hypothetical protein
VLRGRVVSTAASLSVDLGTGPETWRCVGLAEDGFVVESERALPLNRVLRCRLVVPDVAEMDLFAFAASEPVGDRQEVKPMGMSGEMAERWFAIRQAVGGTTRARGTGPTRPLKTGVYVSIPRSRTDWFWRLLQRLR